VSIGCAYNALAISITVVTYYKKIHVYRNSYICYSYNLSLQQLLFLPTCNVVFKFLSTLHQIPEILHHPRPLLHTNPLRPRRLLRHIPMHNPRIRAIIQALIRADQNHPKDKTPKNRHAEHGRHDAVAVPVAIGRHVPDVAASDISELTECVDHGDCDGAFGWGAREGG
jgi:hypothetical protein